jgi:glyoxylase-like metal-dependent hydrolase (beta-lactamase superfamily II)
MSSYILHSIEGNRQRLDGGSMYGNVPRTMWAPWSPPDGENRIELACRTFLIEDLGRDLRILLEAGIGVFFHPKKLARFGVIEPGGPGLEGVAEGRPEHVLLKNLAALGVAPDAIDVVVLSHLHFDHAGGLLTPYRAEGSYELVFPHARVLVGRRHWERAKVPHQRDRVSFVPELLRLLEESGRLELVDGESSPTLGDDFSFTFSDGHTPGLMLTELRGGSRAVVFCGDLIPGCPWIHVPVTMGYDRFPELLVDEKEQLLRRCVALRTRLLFTHDPSCAMCRVEIDERGRFVAVEGQAAVKGLEL